MWVYAVGSDDNSTVYVYRRDMRPKPPLTLMREFLKREAIAQHWEQPLNARGLEQALWALNDQSARRLVVVWDPQARAEVERECRDRGVNVTFADWLGGITVRRFHTEPPSTGPPSIPGSYATSFGITSDSGSSHGSDSGSSHGSGDFGGFGGF